MNTIMRVVTGREAQVVDEAARSGLFVHCPLRTVEVRRKRWHQIARQFIRARRPVIEARPVLPGYLFADVDDAAFHDLVELKHVIQVASINRRDEADVARFMARVDRGDFNFDGAFGHLQPGQVMRLVGGVFDQMLVSFRAMRGERVVVEADLLGARRRMAVDVDGVEAV